MTKIEAIWQELEISDLNHGGLIYKRYSASVVPDVFVALKVQERIRCIALRVSANNNFDISEWDKLRDIKIETSIDDKNRKNKFLLLSLLNRKHADIFSILCEDLIYEISELDSEQLVIDRLLDRLTKWGSLFQMVSSDGLSDENQRGLFGELFFLKDYIANTSDSIYCLKSWLGPEKSIQDFQSKSWAVEVKTTHGNNHQKIHITSERQLDDSIVNNIYLFHLSLDIRAGNGITLNSLVDSVEELVSDSTIASNLYKMKLMEYGYYDLHRPIYEKQGYSIRQENIYQVKGNFPRITENQIPNGVGDVRYSIVLTESEEWRITRTQLFNEIERKDG